MSQSQPSRKQQSFWWDLHNVFVILLIRAAGLSDDHLHTNVSFFALGDEEANMLAQVCVSSSLMFAWSFTFRALLLLVFLLDDHCDVVTTAVTPLQGCYRSWTPWGGGNLFDLCCMNFLQVFRFPPTVHRWTKLCMCKYEILCVSLCLLCDEVVACVMCKTANALATLNWIRL